MVERLLQAWPTWPRSHLSTETSLPGIYSLMIACPAKYVDSNVFPAVYIFALLLRLVTLDWQEILLMRNTTSHMEVRFL